MSLVPLLFFAAAISIDGVAVGLAYGMRSLRVPPLSKMIVGVASGLSVCLSMSIGLYLAKLLNPSVARYIGALVLSSIGFFLIREGLSERESSQKVPCDDDMDRQLDWTINIRIKPFRLVIQILKEPSLADVDRSGYISPVESFFLGVALALDAFGAGIGAGLARLPLFATGLLTCVMAVGFLEIGLRSGNLMKRRTASKTKALPGVILIGLGIIKLFR